jgi:hypothetical protein
MGARSPEVPSLGRGNGKAANPGVAPSSGGYHAPLDRLAGPL